MISRLHRLDATLLILVGLSIATVWVPPLVPGALPSNAILLTLAALKGRTIVLDYLDLRAAPAIWRGLVNTWVLSVVALAWAASAVMSLT
jgi:Prokaryotic Cytochrome C oxidase subunit IV